jgi:hypothetical protein
MNIKDGYYTLHLYLETLPLKPSFRSTAISGGSENSSPPHPSKIAEME